MDDMEFLVAETFKHLEQNFLEQEEETLIPEEVEVQKNEYSFPEESGLIYHVQKTTSVFVIRTFVSQNIRKDYLAIMEAPENYPSLRLLEGGSENIASKLKFFLVEDPSQAEIIHDQLHNRRFPVHEEMICNISDPGFSWWLTKKNKSFQLAFTMSVANESGTIKLGPLGDKELALKFFKDFESLVTSAGIEMNIQNETNRVQFTDCEEFILEELKDVFEFGVVSDTMRDLFKILSKKSLSASKLESTWFFLQEIAAMRRFWIQIEFDLNAG